MRTSLSVSECATVEGVVAGPTTDHPWCDLVLGGFTGPNGARAEVRIQIEHLEDLDRLEEALVAAHECFRAQTARRRREALQLPGPQRPEPERDYGGARI